MFHAISLTHSHTSIMPIKINSNIPEDGFEDSFENLQKKGCQS